MNPQPTLDALGRRRRPSRSSKPEYLIIGGKTFARNDIAAKDKSLSERGLNREDARGAASILIGGIKYRPLDQLDEHFLARVQLHPKAKQPPKSKRGRRS